MLPQVSMNVLVAEPSQGGNGCTKHEQHCRGAYGPADLGLLWAALCPSEVEPWRRLRPDRRDVSANKLRIESCVMASEA